MTNENSDLNPQRVMVAMSGGVDSAVTTALLLEAGMDVHAMTLRLWRAPFVAGEDAVQSAQATSDALGIPLTVVDLESRFYTEVVLPFVDAYGRGLTPNPCVMCNPTVKFAALLAEADRAGAQWMATGHYARLLRDELLGVHLCRAADPQRDQSYVLYRLPQRMLRRLRLPLGDVAGKAAVRDVAHRLSLASVDRPDSQDLCFLGGGDYRELLRSLCPERVQPGPIYDVNGVCLGTHEGLPLYTVGQRKGLKLVAEHPLYVLRLLPDENALIVGSRSQLAQDACELESVLFVAGDPPAATFAAQAAVRYHASPLPVHVTMLSLDRARVSFDVPTSRSLTPGQSLVLYQEDEVLGGGLICPDDASVIQGNLWLPS